jgi:hypothetical protein
MSFLIAVARNGRESAVNYMAAPIPVKSKCLGLLVFAI